MMNKAKECESNNFNNNNNEVVSTEKETGRIWWYESASVISVCTSCISCGNFLGYTSSAVPSMIEDVDTFDYEKHYNAFMFIGGLGSLGALLGAVLSGIPLRFIGPRRTIALFGLPLLIASWVMIGLSQNITTVLVGRFLGGVGVGAIICCAPLYVIDISSISNRGKMGVIPQFLMISGILISYILGAFFTWNSFALVTVFFSIVAMILISFAPDSPKWLILKNKGEEGLAILEKIHGTSAAKVIYKNIESSISSSSQQQLNSQGEKNNIWKNKATLKCILVCLGVISIQQLSGVNGITFFAATIFSQSSSSSSSEGHMPSIILAATQLVASFLSTFFVERFGRRFLLKLSSATLTISGGVLGAHFYWLVDLKELTWLPLVALIVFAFGFAIGLGPVTWIFVAEILPPQVRNVVNPLIIAYNWFCVFLITSSFPWLKDEIYYYGIFWLYATIAGVGFVFICLFVPETKGKSCDEIQMHFSGKDTIVVNNLQFSCS